MGMTILMDVALEVTREYQPWESGQVVVGLSRTKTCKQITIVTDMSKREAVMALWNCLCKCTQWTAMIDRLMNDMAVSAHSRGKLCMNMVESYPLRVCDYSLPVSNSGYVYMLISSVCHDEIYVGQTSRNIAVRLKEHNRGTGSDQTAIKSFMPWGVAAYIDKLASFSDCERMRLESRWSQLNKLTRNKGGGNINNFVMNGQQVVDQYNAQQHNPEDWISFHICIQYKRESVDADNVKSD